MFNLVADKEFPIFSAARSSSSRSSIVSWLFLEVLLFLRSSLTHSWKKYSQIRLFWTIYRGKDEMTRCFADLGQIYKHDTCARENIGCCVYQVIPWIFVCFDIYRATSQDFRGLKKYSKICYTLKGNRSGHFGRLKGTKRQARGKTACQNLSFFSYIGFNKT